MSDLRDRTVQPHERMEVGKAAEHLVCADLILLGFRAFLADQGLPYDVVVDVEHRLLRIQVKATASLYPDGRGVYRFNPRRKLGGDRARRPGLRDCDLYAFVALDRRVIGYLAVLDVPQCLEVFPPGTVISTARARTRGNIDQLSFPEALTSLAKKSGDLFTGEA